MSAAHDSAKCAKDQQMVTELPARRDLCDDYLRQATLVDFRGSSLSDPGSIPGISTNVLPQGGTFCFILTLAGSQTLQSKEPE